MRGNLISPHGETSRVTVGEHHLCKAVKLIVERMVN